MLLYTSIFRSRPELFPSEAYATAEWLEVCALRLLHICACNYRPDATCELQCVEEHGLSECQICFNVKIVMPS